MAAKRLDIHPAALTELKSAVSWYDERSASAGDDGAFPNPTQRASSQLIPLRGGFLKSPAADEAMNSRPPLLDGPLSQPRSFRSVDKKQKIPQVIVL
jgi:hypothetical protein